MANTNTGNDARRRRVKRGGKLSASVTSFFAGSSRRFSGNFNEEDLVDDSGKSGEPREGGGHASRLLHHPSSRLSHVSRSSDPPSPHHNIRSSTGASRRASGVPRNRRASISTPSHGGDPLSQLQRSFHDLDLPSALVSEVFKQKLGLRSRFFLLENSISMGTTHGGHTGKVFSNGKITRTTVSLWEEVVDCMKYQSRLATRNSISTRIWLVNEPPAGMAHKYIIGKGHSKTETEDLIDGLKEIIPSSKECPLASRVRNLTKCLVRETEHYEEGEFVVLTICTRGKPTDKHGRSNSDSREEFREAISSLSRSSVPVKIIIRLTTDDDGVCDYYNQWDTSISDVDVLDDWFGESLEVNLHNPWLTYTLGMHRLRESGLAPDLFDYLDERQLTINEIHRFCNMMFVGRGGAPLPNPNLSWSAFVLALEGLVEKEKPQWNSVKNGLRPWIDTQILNKYETPMAQSSSRWRVGTRASLEPEETGGRTSSQRFYRPPRDFDYRRSQSDSNATAGRTQRERPASSCTATRPIGLSGVTLSDRLRSWSHPTKDAKKPFSVDKLLVTVPLLFPPDNELVEDHPYFSRWKAIDEDAFWNIDDEAQLGKMLKRAVLKAKLFLHPDKLPKDCTENQNLLFRTMWEAILEYERAS